MTNSAKQRKKAFGKISELFSEENEAKIRAWLSEKLPAAIEQAKSALNEFLKFIENVNKVIDKVNELTATDRQAKAKYDEVKASGGTEFEARNAYDQERARILKEQAQEKQWERERASWTTAGEGYT